MFFRFYRRTALPDFLPTFVSLRFTSGPDFREIIPIPKISVVLIVTHTTYNKYIHPMQAKSKVMLTPLQGALVNARDMLARAVPLVYFTILTVRSATTPSVGMSITTNPTIKNHADERSARPHSLWLTPVDPGAISPVILCTVVWYWTPLYFFRPAALFTRLSLSTRWRHQTCVTHQW